ncbi:MAG: hypothetical protein QGI78_07620 [Phycisphaerales bacterium]|nr:hypothetical protein [Phycisphaerales bacterium]
MNLETAAFRILGIHKANDPTALLGIPQWNGDRDDLEIAIRRRIAQVLSHPKRHSPEANLVREAIKEAGVVLLQECTTKSKQSNEPERIHELTALDRSIIAVLVSEGGWNRKSRARLVAVSAAYGLTVGGLLRILSALAEASRSGKGPLALPKRNEALQTKPLASLPLTFKRRSVVDDLIDETAEKYVPELKNHTPETVVKLSVLFVLLTFLLIILSLRVLSLANEEAERSKKLRAESPVLIQGDVALGSPPIHDPAKEASTTYPTFDVELFSPTLTTVVERAAEVPRILKHVVEEIERAAVLHQELSQDTLQVWDDALTTFSLAWPFVSSDAQNEVGMLLISVFEISPQIEQLPARLLQPFYDASERLLSNPYDFVRNIWLMGELSRLLDSQKLLPTTDDLIRGVERDLPYAHDVVNTRRAYLQRQGFEIAKAGELEEDVLQYWEFWLAMISREHKLEDAYAMKCEMLRVLLRTTTDLTRESTTKRVIGRFIVEIDWKRSDVASEFLFDVYRDPELSSVDVWAFTQLLYSSKTIPWFFSEHIVELSSDMDDRLAILTTLENVWPEPVQTPAAKKSLVLPAGYDPTVVSVWSELTTYCSDPTIEQPKQFLYARQLNEIAAMIWLGRPSKAWELIDNFDQARLYSEPQVPTLQSQSGGNLSSQFPNTNKDINALMDLLDYIRTQQYESLHKNDATIVVRAALFHKNDEIRNEAASLICEFYTQDPLVAQTIVTVLTPRAKSAQINQLVANVTNELLPPKHDPAWYLHVRRAFVQHALTSASSALADLDDASSAAAVSAIGEALAVDPSRVRPTHEVTVSDAYDLLLHAWSVRVGTIDDSLAPTSQFQEDVLNTQVQQQRKYLKYLHRLEQQWSGERPQQQDIESTHASTVLDQLVTLERVALQTWRRMFDRANAQFESETH